MGEHRDFKFDVRVDHSKSQPTDDKLFLKGAWSRHVTNLKFLVTLNISGTAKAKDFKFYSLVAHMKYWPRDDKLSFKWRVRGHVTNFKFRGPQS